jgi:hypothetical protein
MKDTFMAFTENTSSGGLSRKISAFLAGLSSSLVRNKKTLIVTLNPVSKRQQVQEELEEILLGAASALLKPSVFKNDYLLCDWNDRYGVRKNTKISIPVDPIGENGNYSKKIPNKDGLLYNW